MIADRFLLCCLATLAAAGIALRPWRLPEAVWPVGAALIALAAGALSPLEALRGLGDGLDVYLFLAGMMLLAELAREEGLFDWLAAEAAYLARGSAKRLFFFVYLLGILVTVFLSNDATAVVLTPAVITVTRAARIEHPLPYLFVCAFVANAASFVLPISNPANLVVYGSQIPPLSEWLARFTLPSLLAISVTLVVLYLTQRGRLSIEPATAVPRPPLSATARTTGIGILLTALILMGASAASLSLGAPTLIAALATIGLVSGCKRKIPWKVFLKISWSVLPMVGGLFILVRALEGTGIIALLRTPLVSPTTASPGQVAALSAAVAALASNLVNNLPVGLLAGRVIQSAHAIGTLPAAVLVGVDLGPNLSVTGSLATLLWLFVLRRERISVQPLEFLRLGVLLTTPALVVAVGAILLSSSP
jgi:arsenical pump membrane protein